MSIDAKIDELIGAMTALTAVLSRTAENQERLLAGQEKAIEKLEGAKAEKEGKATRGRGRPPKDTPSTSDESADTESGAAGAGSVSDAPVNEEPVKFAAYAKAWLNSAEKDSPEFKRRGKFIMGILGNFGAGKMSELDEKHEKAALFYVKRDEAGKEVKFDVEYDFDGDPAQDEPESEDFGGAFDD